MDDYYCEVCNKTIKLKSKKKLSVTKSHRKLSTSKVNRYCVKIPELIEKNEILKNMLIFIIKDLSYIRLYVNGNYSLKIQPFVLNQGKRVICLPSQTILGI